MTVVYWESLLEEPILAPLDNEPQSSRGRSWGEVARARARVPLVAVAPLRAGWADGGVQAARSVETPCSVTFPLSRNTVLVRGQPLPPVSRCQLCGWYCVGSLLPPLSGITQPW